MQDIAVLIIIICFFISITALIITLRKYNELLKENENLHKLVVKMDRLIRKRGKENGKV